MPPKLDVVGMVVQDMARTLSFYRQLGLEIPTDADGQPHVECTLPNGLRVCWDTVETIRSFDPEWKPSSGGHRISLAFLFDSPAEVDAAYASLTWLGFDGHKAPWDAFWGQRYAIVDDPEGNAVDLFAPLPTT
jgi:catechol 2,3-dioxygenase-like lactoylglutathione lyase family enzyme